MLYSLSRSNKQFCFIKSTITKRSHINGLNSMENRCIPLVKGGDSFFKNTHVINMSLYNPNSPPGILQFF